ncbi:MAG: hypothetical protein HQK83_08450 [Fibrobacteria bacterium]|nr:hypothetical protein [Fibrobacteria bacterium]
MTPRIPEPEYQHYVSLGLNVTDIQIIDQRKGIKKGEIDVPFFALPGKHYSHIPVLHQEDKDVIKRAIRDKSSKAGLPVSANVYVDQGVQKVDVGWMTCKMSAHTKVSVYFTFENGRGDVFCSGHSSNYIEGGIVHEKHLIKMIKTSYKVSTKMCLEKVKEEVDRLNISGKRSI